MAQKAAKKKAVRQPIKPVSTGDVMLAAALDVAKKAQLQSLVVYVDGLDSLDSLNKLPFDDTLKIILITRTEEAYKAACALTDMVVRLPEVNLTRTGQIKMAAMLSFSKRQLLPGERFVYLTGLSQGKLDTMMVMQVGAEYEMFQSVDQPPITEHIRRAVFERVLNLALELAAEGREGKPLGAIFVLGDSNDVIANSKQLIINPFKGYDDSERNILDDQMRETVKEFATIDGAFVIKGNGTIVSAGTYLLPKVIANELPQGLGARHMAAAAITAATKSIAITISESTGTVRIWRQGELITEIEKAKPSHNLMVDTTSELPSLHETT
ncbi:MAG: diadenylate cyclase [Sedimentisphaerales bacterium]|nr:diadenylate cyclase [Sedimentisphaerales bacterium]